MIGHELVIIKLGYEHIGLIKLFSLLVIKLKKMS